MISRNKTRTIEDTNFSIARADYLVNPLYAVMRLGASVILYIISSQAFRYAAMNGDLLSRLAGADAVGIAEYLK